MSFEHNGQMYSTVMGSSGRDPARDGMFLELSVAGSLDVLMEAFYSDEDGSFSLTGFGSPVPLEVVERFVAEARERLPPTPEA